MALSPTLGHVARAHVKCSASKEKQWRGCPGSIQACEGLPALPSSPAAAAGTRLHEKGEAWLRTGRPKDTEYLPLPDGSEALVDEGVRSVVWPYVEAVRAEVEANLGSELLIEQKLDGTWLDPDMGGSFDAIVKVPFSHLVVFDLKTGKHCVEDQTQLAIYAILAMWEDGGWGDYQYAETVIVQPTADHGEGPIRRMRWYLHELQALAKTLAADAAKTREPGAPRRAGDHCRWCAARGACPEAARAVAHMAATDFDPIEQTLPAEVAQQEVILPPAKLLTDEQLGKALQFADLLDSWVEGVRAFAKGKLLAGKPVIGRKLIAADRSWGNEAGAIQLMEQLGVEPYTMKTRTVSQAEEFFQDQQAAAAGGKRGAKTAAKKAFEEAAAGLIERPLRNAKMVKESDRRQALVIDPEAAAAVTFDGSADDHEF